MLTKFTDSNRYYVRANQSCFKQLFRKIAVPKISKVVFEKGKESKVISLLLDINYEGIASENEDEDEEMQYSLNDLMHNNSFGIHMKEANDALSDENPHVCIGWSFLGDLTGVGSKEALAERYEERRPSEKPRAKGQNVGQVWRCKCQYQNA